jgi:D-sedoheptulose 7-phosphate isomerase
MKNYQPKSFEQSAVARQGYVFGCEHRFFSDYAKLLGGVLADANWANVLKLAEMILEAHKSGRRIFLCGNGGSAANAMHIANDLVYAVAEKTGSGIDAMSLSANTALLTCLGNDVGYENIYSEQLAVSGRAGDILIVFSGSGNSQNNINAIHTAHSRGMRTAAILGYDGGLCKQVVGLPIHFNIADMQVAEDLQLTVGHMVMNWLKKEIVEIQ